MTSDPKSTLFDFAASNRVPTNEEEKTVTELHAALGTTGVPLRLRRPPTPAPSRPWRSYMFAALTAVLVVAVATAGLFAIREQATTPPTEIPEVVLGLASEEPNAASPVTAATCDFTGDVPIFTAANESPIDQPSIIVNLEGEMKLICNGEETLLAEGVRMANGTETPHVLQAMSQEGVLLINIATGEKLLIPRDHNSAQQSISISSLGKWIILPSNDDNTLTSLYNLETFAETPVRAGGKRVDLASISRMAFSADNETVAITITSADESDTEILEGILVATADGASRFIEPAVPGEPKQLTISPDGQSMAIRSFEGTGFQGTNTLTIINTSDGAIANSVELGEYDAFIDLTWLHDGSGLLFTDSEALYQVASPGENPVAIFEGQEVSGLVLTKDDNVIAISHVDSSEAGPSQPKTTIRNLETGEEITLDGRDMWAGSTPLATRRTTLVLVDAEGTPPGNQQFSRIAVDAITGETIGEIDYNAPDTDGFNYSSWGHDGNITAVAFSPDSMWKLVDENGNPALEQIPSPPLGNESMQGVLLMNSPQGYMSIRIFEPTSTWLLLPGADEWIEVDIADPEDSQGIHPSVSFVHGDQPQSTGSAEATAEASTVAAGTCELSGETPLVIGAETPQFDGTNVIITPSGEMKLICGDTETSLATGVDFAFPMSAPNVLLAETDSGAILINIATREAIELPYSAMLILQKQDLIAPWGSWMVAPSSDDQMMVSLYDLRTLIEIPLIYDANPDHRVVMDAVAGISVNSTDSHVAVSVSFQHSSSSRYLQGFFVADADGNSRFIHTERDVLPRAIALSPDGETIATSWYQGTMELGQTNISLYDASDGHLKESWEMQTGDIQIELTWLHDGSGLVFTDGTALYRLDAEHPGDGFQVLFEGPEVGSILLTPDQKTVVVNTTEPQQQGLPLTQTAIVNIETGEITLLDGRDLWASSFGPAATRTVLVLHDFFGGQSNGSITFTVVDSVTGEVIGEIDHNPPAQMSISNATSQRGQGDTDFFSLSADSTWQLLDVDGQPDLQQISPPDGRSDEAGSDLLVTRGGDGTIVMTFFDPFEVWVQEPGNDEWRQLDVAPPDNDLGLPVVVMFIPGTD